MDELRPLLERARDAIPAPPGGLHGLAERRRARRRNQRLGTAAVALALAGAGILLGGRAFRSLEVGPAEIPGVARTGPVRLQTSATVTVGEYPLDLAVGEGAIWAVTQPSQGSPELVRIDPESNRVVDRAPYVGDPQQLAAGAGAVWGVRGPDHLVRVDPSSLEVTPTTETHDEYIGAVVAGAEGVWIVLRGAPGSSPSLARVDPVTAEVVDEVRLEGLEPYVIGLELAAGSVWVRGWEDPEHAEGCARILRIDPDEGTVGQDLIIEGSSQSGAGGLRIAAGEGAVWLNCREARDQLFAVGVDASTGEIADPFALPAGVFWPIGAGPEGMWAAGFGAGEEPLLLLVDPSSGDVRGSMELPGAWVESAVYDSSSGTVWVPDLRGAADSLMRIDTVPADTSAKPPPLQGSLVHRL